MTAIIGLNKEIEDAGTGATTDFHRICTIQINRRNGGISATFDSYVSQSKWEQGRQPVSVMQQTSLILAENEAMGTMDLDSWVYTESVKVETDVYGNANPIFGAKLVPKSIEA